MSDDKHKNNIEASTSYLRATSTANTKNEFSTGVTKAALMETPINKMFDPSLLSERAQSVTKYDLLKLMARETTPETSDLTLKDIYSINSAIYKEFAGGSAIGDSALHGEENIYACCCTTTVCCCCSASSVNSPSVKSKSDR